MSPFHVVGSIVLPPILAALAVIDIRSHRLPDLLTVPLVALGVLASGLAGNGLLVPSLAGAAVGYAAFAVLGAFHHRRRGTEGLGLGDAKLLAAGGAWLGVSALPFAVLGAALPALVFAVTRGASASTRIAFGPWIALAIMVLWGMDVLGLGPAGPRTG
ncbi:prepilin peptidase [Palleronia rufa]|uniref:prepilin peptidase n=1 Tax=Palleronia rufa TaxID=1530186 RepID=UPI00068A6FBA|nr:A24 family peptidase [Palleronia rufa]